MTSLDIEHDYIPGERPEPEAAPTIGPPPFEAALAKAVVACMAALAGASSLAVQLQHAPRDSTAVGELFLSIDHHTRVSLTHYRAFLEILECEAQA